MKKLGIEEEASLVRVLAEIPTESTSHMTTSDRERVVLTMLQALQYLATNDGFVAAVWALELIVGKSSVGRCVACERLLFNGDDFILHTEGYELCDECVAASD